MRLMTSLRLALAAGLLAVAAPALAQNFPSKPIKIVVPTPPGGLADVFARLLAQQMTVDGATAVVENKTGASGIIAADFVAKSPADGYTVFMGYHATHAMLQHLGKLPYDPVKDFAPVAYIGLAPNVLVVNPSVPAKSVAELIAHAKANPGKLTFASQGNGTTGHLGGEQFKQRTGLDMTHVPYRGAAPAVQDLIGGQVAMMFDVVPLAKPHIEGGKVRALAVAMKQRSEALPDVPTMTEAGLPEIEAGGWWGILAPAGTPAATVAWLNQATNKAFSMPETRKRLTDQGVTLKPGTPAEFAQWMALESKRWGEVIRAAGIKVE